MIFGYARVSTSSQKVDRQLIELSKFGIIDKNIYIDKQSGKDFKRRNYQRLKRKMKEGDVLVIKSIDRLGRNYEMILLEWQDITKNKKIDIVVLDMNLLDTRCEGKNLMGKFVADLVLQILSFVAENERANILERQREGIRIAMENGVRFGRPKYILPTNFNQIINDYKAHVISLKEALAKTKMKRSTFYKYLTMETRECKIN